jgi:hypothetical protein
LFWCQTRSPPWFPWTSSRSIRCCPDIFSFVAQCFAYGKGPNIPSKFNKSTNKWVRTVVSRSHEHLQPCGTNKYS